MFNNYLGENFHTNKPELKPLYEHLPSRTLAIDSNNFRTAKESQIFGALEYMGMNGLTATSDFSGVNHYIIWRAAQEQVIRLDGEIVSVIDFLERYNLAIAAVGGTGAMTMAKWSDCDLMLIAPKNADELLQNSVFTYGFKEVRTKFADLVLASGIPDIDLPFDAPEHVHEQFDSLLKLDPDRVRDRQEFQRVLSSLSLRFLFGEESTFQKYDAAFRSAVLEHADLVLCELCHNIAVRHAEYGFNSQRTVPDMKESPGFLRDIDAIRWLMKINGILNGEESTNRLFTANQWQLFEAACSIQLQLKYSLHHDYSKGSSRNTTKEVNTLYPERIIPAFRTFSAIIPPHSDQGRSASRLLYEQAENVSMLLSVILEKVAGEDVIERCLSRPKAKVSVSQLITDVVEKSKKEILVECFALIQKVAEAYQDSGGVKSLAVLSLEERSLVKFLKGISSEVMTQDFELLEVQKAFSDLISNIPIAGRAIKYMHQAGLLTKILPAFGEINKFNEIGSYLNATLDTHSIDAVEALGAIARREIKGQEYLADILASIENPSALVLATLLHDIGRKRESEDREKPGADSSILKGHATIGAEMARYDLESLGFQGISALTCSLIENHSLLLEVAYGINSANRKDLEDLVAKVKSRDYLDQLFLLTFVDKYASNREAFSAAKQRWLAGVYNLAAKILSNVFDQQHANDALVHAVAQQLPKNLNFTDAEVRTHLNFLPVAYGIEFDERIIAKHVAGVRYIQDAQQSGMLDVDPQLSFVSSPGESPFLWDLVLVAPDRSRLFLDIAASLYSRGLNIVSADLFTRYYGGDIACDVFSVCPSSYQVAVNLPKDRQSLTASTNVLNFDDSRENLLKALVKSISQPNSTLPDLPHVERQNSNGILVSPKVVFKPTTQVPNTADLRVECRDTPGLAYLIAKILWENNVQVSRAKLGTGNRGVRNIFRIHNSSEGPITDDQLQNIERELMQALSST